MVKFKRKVLILFSMIMLVSVPVFAGGIGYIDYDRVANEYQYAKKTILEIQARENEIRQYLDRKEEEFSRIESAIQKKKFEETVRSELEIKEKAFNNFREKKEEDVYNRIHAISEKIRLEKGFDAILDARSVFSGGEDITDLMIQKLNSNITR